MERGLYASQTFWNVEQRVAHGDPAKASQNQMSLQEADYARLLCWIQGNAGSSGNCVITLEGRLYEKWALVDTLTVVASGVSEVTGQKLIDVRGFAELRGNAVYTDVAGKYVDVQVFIGASYK